MKCILLLFIHWSNRFSSFCIIWMSIGYVLSSSEIGITWMVVHESCICSWEINDTLNLAFHWPTPTIVPWIRNTVDTFLQSQCLNHRYSISNGYRWRNECSTKHAVKLKVKSFSWKWEFYCRMTTLTGLHYIVIFKTNTRFVVLEFIRTFSVIIVSRTALNPLWS